MTCFYVHAKKSVNGKSRTTIYYYTTMYQRFYIAKYYVKVFK